ncbi:MAG: sialidase family protein [Acidobacteriota bacterium]
MKTMTKVVLSAASAASMVLWGCAPPVAEEAQPVDGAPAEKQLAAAGRSDSLDGLVREPMIVRHPAGRLFVSGYGSQVTGTNPESSPLLWSSDDDGATWKPVDVGDSSVGAAGNSDVDLHVGPEGTLYFASMGFDRAERAGTHIAIGASADGGESWAWNRISETKFDDRPWVRATPSGTAHAIWNDGEGVRHAVSSDRGQSWEERDAIYERGGSSHFAVGPSGELAVRIAPISASGNVFDEGLELLAVSADDGTTWTTHAVPGDRQWDPTFSDPNVVPRWVEPIAWTDDGRLHALWSEGAVVQFATSSDRGESWSTGELTPVEGIAFFPYMIADGNALVATWFEQDGEELYTRLARIDGGEASEATLSERFQPDSFLEAPDPTVRNSAGEYVPPLVLPNGRHLVVTPIQDKANERWGFTTWSFEL